MKQTPHFARPFKHFFVFSLLCAITSQAMAGLVLNPQRIVFQDRERSTSLDLLNTSDEMGRYQIYFENKYMREDGSIVDVEHPEKGGPYAGDMIRYSPRRVDIKAGGSQTIRLAVRRPKDLADGEYLSHLVLKQIPNKIPEAAPSEHKNADDQQLTLTVQPILKIAIPVIVRKGLLETHADITDITSIKNEAGLVSEVHFTLLKEGGFSLYGNVELFENQEGLGKRIGFIRGIALYNSTPKRLVRITLDKPQNLSHIPLLLRFVENEKYGGKNRVEKSITFD